MIRALPRRDCRISIAETQTRLQALSLFSTCSRLNELFPLSVDMCPLANISSDYAKQLFRMFHTWNLINITTLSLH